MKTPFVHRLAALATMSVLTCTSAITAAQDPQVAPSPTPMAASQPLQPGPIAAPDRSERPIVTVYDFDSSVPEVNGKAATDMFKTALFKTGRFRVLERARLSETMLKEKQLNAADQTTGDTAQQKLVGARYIFEGTISEASASTDSHSSTIGIGGLQLQGGRNTDVIGIDVQIVDADTGEILDAIDVRTPIESRSSSVGGVAALLTTVAAAKGHAPSPYTPDIGTQDSHKDSVSAALRTSIEAAVQQLAQRFATQPH